VCWAMLAAVAGSGPVSAQGQELAGLQLAERGPVFYAAPASPGGRAVRIDAGRVAALRKRIAVDLHGATIPEALAVIAGQSGLRFTYDKAVLPADARVTVKAEDLTVAATLTQVLLDANVDVELGATGLVSLVVRGHRRGAPATGAIVGRVTDAKSGRGIAYATVVLEGTGRGATASDSGTYRIGGIPIGTYAVTARALGYRPVRQSVTIVAGQATVADVAIERSPSQLDQVVVAGTLVPAEVKALPTPVSVITADDIAEQHARTTDVLFREIIPGALAPEIGTEPDATLISVRGASTLTGAGGTMKIFLDGVELSDFTGGAVDPASVDHIEVIRGPEAAAIYGSDAIGGVMLIFTKRGSAGLGHPQVDVQAGLGTTDSPYISAPGALRQDFHGTISAGTPDAGYTIGAGYTNVGDWLPQYRLGNPSAFGSVHVGQGVLTLDLSGRYFAQSFETPTYPPTAATGYFFFSKPFYYANVHHEDTYGATAQYAPTSWWRSAVTVGIDEDDADVRQTRPRFTIPSDSELLVEVFSTRKISVGYHTSVAAPLSRAVSGVATVGIDHYALTLNDYFTVGALNHTGTIVTDPSAPLQGTLDGVTNTGYFGQVQLDVREQLFLTLAARAEHNSSFGSQLGTPVSPQAGITLVESIGHATVKLRASFGEAIAPPNPDEKAPIVSAAFIQLANPVLGPQRQLGGDGGLDVVFGASGSLSVTYYNQIARDLIQFALVDPSSTPQSFQYRNLARVKNTGWEFEGTARLSAIVRMHGQFAITGSRIDDLGPNYTGDLQIGDQVLSVPRYTGGLSLMVAPTHGTTVSGGLTYVGNRQNYDQLSQFACFAGTEPCRPTLRDYHMRYPAFAKINLAVDQALTAHLSAFVSADNLANTQADELDNATPVQGRIAMAGLHLHY
jgi:outer membrane receptor protein involved in Fe transport